MRQRISEENIFPSFDLFEEYQKLEAIFSNWRTIGTYDKWGNQTRRFILIQEYIRDIQFENWNLRGTFVNLQEMRTKLNIASENFSKKQINEGQLLDFIQFLLDCWFRIRTTIGQCRVAYLADHNALGMLFEQCRSIETKLHCEDKLDEENHEIYVVYQDELSAEVSQQNPDVANKLDRLSSN